MKFLLRLVVVILIMESAYAQSNLPACRGSNPSRWSNCFGTYTSPSDQKYVGEFKDGKYNGQGTYTLPSGQRYVGEFKDDNYHGQGTLTFPNGTKYVGEFKDDNYHGQGTLTFPSGQKYVGEFKNDQRNGQGTLTFPNGNKYVGQWKDDSLNGQGTLFNANGSIINQGIWSDDYFVRSTPVQQATTPDRDNKRLNAEAEAKDVKRKQAEQEMRLNQNKKTNSSQVWEKGMEYAYYGGECTPSENLKCLSFEQYKRACKETDGVSNYAIRIRAVNSSGEEKILLEAGTSAASSVFWGRTNAGAEACGVEVTREGIVNGNSARRVISGRATRFIYTEQGKILVTDFNNYIY